MKQFLFIYCCIAVAGLFSCGKKEAVIVEWKSEKIILDSTTDKYADSSYLKHLQPFREKMEQVMAQKIGYAPNAIKSYPPESPLSNLLADVCLATAKEYSRQPVDLAILNFRGIRSDLPAGDITIGTIFRILPFENELVIVKLRGQQLQNQLEAFASMGGQIVAGIHLEIKNQKPIKITINQKPLDPNQNYIIATSDYLAEGNDGMTYLAKYETLEKTGIKIRDMFIHYIQQQSYMGKVLVATTDGRITIRN